MVGQLVASKRPKTSLYQAKMPLYEALLDYANSDVTAFDVPGHKRGQLNYPLVDSLGRQTLKMDANSMKELDLLSHPESVIKEAQQLAADAFHAEHAFFLVNGTTVGILAMILATCKPNQQIIVPRNCHKSVMNGIILSGASPLFIQPAIDRHFGITYGISFAQVKTIIDEQPLAKTLLLTYPTYFGSMTDLTAICEYAHANGVTVLVDSAHGAHLIADTNYVDPMTAGADVVTLSMHKTAGSLTQSSLLLVQGDRVAAETLQKTLNMLQTTSASYLLMSSLDVARHELVHYGEQRLQILKPIVEQAIAQIEHSKLYEVLKPNYVKTHFQQEFDWTKLVIRVNELGLTGFEVYTLLKEQFHIQAELAEGYVIMCVISYMDTAETIAKLVRALLEIERKFNKYKSLYYEAVVMQETNDLRMTPQQASFAEGERVDIKEAIGFVSKDSLMIYPPGIPLIIPGEVISQQTVEQYHYYCQNFGNVLNETEEKNTITVVKGDR